MNKNFTISMALALGAIYSSLAFGEVTFKGITPIPFDKELSQTLHKERAQANKDKDTAKSIEASLKLMSMEQNITNIHRTRMDVAYTVRYTLKDSKNAFKLYMEIFEDKTATPDQRADGAKIAADISQRDLGGDPSVESILKAALALPVSQSIRVNFTQMLATHYRNIQKKPELARAEYLGAATNSVFSADQRSSFISQAIDIDKLDKSKKTAEAKLELIPIAKAILGEAELSARSKETLRFNLFNAFENAKAKEDANAMATEVVANCAIFPGNGIKCATYLANNLVNDKDDFVAAIALLSKCYGFEKLTQNDYAKIAEEIGKIHILKNDFDGALAEYNKLPARNQGFAPALEASVKRLTLELYKTFFRFEDAVAFALKSGDKFNAAKILAENLDKTEEAAKLYKEVVTDKVVHSDSRPRIDAYMWLYSRKGERAFVDANFEAMLGSTTRSTNDLKGALAGKLSGYTMRGNYESSERTVAHLSAIYKALGEKPALKEAKRMVLSAAGVGNLKLASERAREAADALEASAKFEPKDLYRFRMAEKVLVATGNEKALIQSILKNDQLFKGTISNKDRVEVLNQVGSLAMIANNEGLVRAVKDATATLYKKGETRTYTVKYSKKPILGIESFASLKLEKTKLSRKFDQNMDFLDTDVATGNRGEGIGSEKGKESNVPEMEIVADNYGIHFLFTTKDERAREVEAGLIGGGGFEGYIAPGENQPYACLIFNNVPNAKCNFFDTTYDTMGHRRFEAHEELSKSEVFFRDGEILSYLALSWNAYATLIPENGTAWDFENVLWSRAGAPAWNGTESIHGRSTWGKLIFELTPEARAAILKGVIFDAFKKYNREFTTNHGGEGVIDYWKDDEIGDAEFYEECIVPLVEKLDGYKDLVKIDMDDATAVKLSEEALPLWRDIRYVISKMRYEYLSKKLLQ